MNDLTLQLDELSGVQYDQAACSWKEYTRLDQKLDTLTAQVQSILTLVQPKPTEIARPISGLSEVSLG